MYLEGVDELAFSPVELARPSNFEFSSLMAATVYGTALKYFKRDGMEFVAVLVEAIDELASWLLGETDASAKKLKSFKVERALEVATEEVLRVKFTSGDKRDEIADRSPPMKSKDEL